MSTQPPFDPASLAAGTVVGDKYVLGPPIGWGAQSVVYECTHRLLHRKAALKILAATDEESERRFAREARMAASLGHPNVVEVYEVGRLSDGRAFLAMERLEGETLEARLEREGPLSIAEALRVGREVLLGLGAAHEKSIVHRDLRPQNIFLAQVRGEEVVKLVDFGVSRRFGAEGDSSLTHAGRLLGEEIHYVAPEQLYENGVIDQRTDLYAVGVLLYRMLAGVSPFRGKGSQLLLDVVERMPPAPSTHRSKLPRDIDNVVMSALAKDKEGRFKDAESMREALRLAGLFASYVEG
ncbi:MAG: serine/threonine-protein kinase [Sandaracinaceae bacterium]